MAELSTNPETIASRERAKLWSEAKKELYRRQSNDRAATAKRIKTLRASDEYKSATIGFQLEMEDSLRGQVETERINENLHDNAPG